MSAGNQRGTRILIGVVALIFSAVLVYFSAAPSFVCTRGAELGPGVNCSVSARALWMFTIADDRLSGVESAEMVASATGQSRTPPHLNLVSGGKRHDLGYFSQLFSTEWETIDQYARNPEAPDLRLGKPLTVQTVSAHAAAAFLLAMGLGMLYSGLRRSY